MFMSLPFQAKKGGKNSQSQPRPSIDAPTALQKHHTINPRPLAQKQEQMAVTSCISRPQEQLREPDADIREGQIQRRNPVEGVQEGRGDAVVREAFGGEHGLVEGRDGRCEEYEGVEHERGEDEEGEGP